MELDRVVAAEPRRVLVREPAELERLAAADAAERGALLLPRRAAFSSHGLREGAILGEEVVRLERRRLVRVAPAKRQRPHNVRWTARPESPLGDSGLAHWRNGEVVTTR
jgi:hypothetical protein